MIYGYARVSTKGQARDGNSLEAQREALLAAGAIEIFTDAFTGTKLDRLSRSLSQASRLITELLDRGVIVHVLNLGVLSNDSVNTLMRNVLLAFAQFERDMIVQRTQEGKAVAKASNPDYREGRPVKYDKEKLTLAMKLLEDHSYSQVTRLTGISKSTLIREKTKEKVYLSTNRREFRLRSCEMGQHNTNVSVKSLRRRNRYPLIIAK